MALCGIANKERAFGLLKELDRKKVAPDEVTYNTLMRGLSLQGKVEAARGLLDEMKSLGIKPDFIGYNTLISGHIWRCFYGSR